MKRRMKAAALAVVMLFATVAALLPAGVVKAQTLTAGVQYSLTSEGIMTTQEMTYSHPGATQYASMDLNGNSDITLSGTTVTIGSNSNISMLHVNHDMSIVFEGKPTVDKITAIGNATVTITAASEGSELKTVLANEHTPITYVAGTNTVASNPSALKITSSEPTNVDMTFTYQASAASKPYDAGSSDSQVSYNEADNVLTIAAGASIDYLTIHKTMTVKFSGTATISSLGVGSGAAVTVKATSSSDKLTASLVSLDDGCTITADSSTTTSTPETISSHTQNVVFSGKETTTTTAGEPVNKDEPARPSEATTTAKKVLSEGTIDNLIKEVTGENDDNTAKTRLVSGTSLTDKGNQVVTKVTDIIETATETATKATELKVSGSASSSTQISSNPEINSQQAAAQQANQQAAGQPLKATISTISGAAKDNLIDNAVKPAIKEFVKVGIKERAGIYDSTKASYENLVGTYEFGMTADSAGDYTFKLEDSMADAMSGDCYAIVLHYTGNASDEDGVTAQFCKISAAGKVTAHFNSFSPISVMATNVTSAQKLVNTYNHGAGSDSSTAINVIKTGTPDAAAAPAPAATANTPAATGNNGAAAANGGAAGAAGKGSASPKTGDTNAAMLLAFAFAVSALTFAVSRRCNR